MCQVSTNKVSSGESADERQLAGHDGCSDDACELLGVLAGVGGVCALDAEHLEDSLLWCEDSAATDGANLDTWHRYSHK